LVRVEGVVVEVVTVVAVEVLKAELAVEQELVGRLAQVVVLLLLRHYLSLLRLLMLTRTMEVAVLDDGFQRQRVRLGTRRLWMVTMIQKL
jgi:hypothetical protein